jgi:hypothetical protein
VVGKKGWLLLFLAANLGRMVRRLILLGLVLAAMLGGSKTASAFAVRGLENRVWEKIALTPESRPVETPQPANTHQEKAACGYDIAVGCSLAAESGLTGAAGRAVETMGPGQGAAYGTRVHSAFEAEVKALGGDFSTEVSYLNGQVVPRGTPGSVRLDVVQGQLTSPQAIFDLKTGSAQLTPQRILQIQQHVPGGANVPVTAIRPP